MVIYDLFWWISTKTSLRMRDMTLFSLPKSLKALEKSIDRFFSLFLFLQTIHLFLLVNNDTFESKNKAREKCEKN